jgi:Rho-binding antiterminator
MISNNYEPIDCNFYDLLEAAATLKKECIIEFFNTEFREEQVVSRIKNLFTDNKVEYMELENGMLIRLDKIIALNGEKLPNAC